MRKIETHGDLLTFGDRMINLANFVSVKPQSLVEVYFAYPGAKGVERARDFPKIIIELTNEKVEVAYGSNEERDADLGKLQEAIQLWAMNRKSPALGGTFSINVAESSNVNIITQSNAVTVHSQIVKSKELIGEIRKLLANRDEVSEEKNQEVTEILDEVETKIDKQEKIPKFTFKSLLQSTSDLAGVAQLVITLGQLIGVIPPVS